MKPNLRPNKTRPDRRVKCFLSDVAFQLLAEESRARLQTAAEKPCSQSPRPTDPVLPGTTPVSERRLQVMWTIKRPKERADINANPPASTRANMLGSTANGLIGQRLHRDHGSDQSEPKS